MQEGGDVTRGPSACGEAGSCSPFREQPSEQINGANGGPRGRMRPDRAQADGSAPLSATAAPGSMTRHLYLPTVLLPLLCPSHP